MNVVDQDLQARRFEQIIGNSLALKIVLEQVERVATADTTVLIFGETGTGKELIAPRNPQCQSTLRPTVD